MFKKVVVLLFLFSIAIGAQEMPRYIDVTGTSRLEVAADQITFSIQIRDVAEQLEESRNNHLKSIKELKKIFDDLQIDEDDWEISPMKFGKEYTYSNGHREMAGFFTNSSANVKLKDFEKYYEFTRKLSVNEDFEIVNSQFGVSNLKAHNKKASKMALKAAMKKAEYMAESLDLKLGNVIQILEGGPVQGFAGRAMMFNAEMDAKSSGSGISGEVTINKTVNIKVQLLNK